MAQYSTMICEQSFKARCGLWAITVSRPNSYHSRQYLRSQEQVKLCFLFRYCCCCSVAKLCPTLYPMDSSTPDFPVHHYLLKLLKFIPVESVMLSNHLILCRPLLLPPSIFSSIRVFSNESVLCIRWPKCWSFNFNISPSNEHSGLISFRTGWLDLLAAQGTLKSLLQHRSSKISILLCSAFFIVQLSYLYRTTGKTIALTRRTFVGKVMSLLLNMLSWS